MPRKAAQNRLSVRKQVIAGIEILAEAKGPERKASDLTQAPFRFGMRKTEKEESSSLSWQQEESSRAEAETKAKRKRKTLRKRFQYNRAKNFQVMLLLARPNVIQESRPEPQLSGPPNRENRLSGRLQVSPTAII